MNSSLSDSLDRLLAQSRPPQIADDGFSNRVLSALPPPVPAGAPLRWTRALAVLVGAAAGIGLCWSQGENATDFAETIVDAAMQLLQPQVGFALLVAGASLLAMYLPTLWRKLSP